MTVPTITADFTSTGAPSRLDADGLSLLQYPATELEAGPCRVWLRLRGSVTTAHPLFGPDTPGRATSHGVVASEARSSPGQRGVTAVVRFEAPAGAGAYGWHWTITNTDDRACEVDLLFTQDVALTAADAVARNEYYVSQYLDLTPLDLDGSTLLCVRQNMPGARQPWLALGSSVGTAGWATDARQLLDRRRGAGLDPTLDLPSTRWQHEHTLAALQTPARTLAPGQTWTGVFWGLVEADHPDATSAADVERVRGRLSTIDWGDPSAADSELADATPCTPTVFSPASHLDAEPAGPDLLADFAPGEQRLVETHEGAFQSCFVGDEHVVSGAKQARVLRPHGSVLHRTPTAVADERGLTSTVWMSGVFCSQLTSGHVNAAPVVDRQRSYLGLGEAGGIRVLVGGPGHWTLLSRPSLWSTARDSARWLYLHDGRRIEVTTRLLSTAQAQLAIESDQPIMVLVPGPVDALMLSGAPVGDDGPAFADGHSRGLQLRTVRAEGHLDLRLTVPAVAEDPSTHQWRLPRFDLDLPDQDVAAVLDALEWLAHDAEVHYRAPRGLEQFTGGAWGTRDVCQGPVGLLLVGGEHAALRDTLLKVFANQQDDGDWPQWFEYLATHATPGHRESHGDVVYWPLLALGEYLLATGDDTILDEPVRWVGLSAYGAPAPVRSHVERALTRLLARRTDDPRLPAYGHGDWNDSLQPARPELAQDMCSTWTTWLEIHSLRILAEGLDGPWPQQADRLRTVAAMTEQALREVLLVDGELAGYAIIRGQDVEHVVHPRDRSTGLRHGVLQMIHSIASQLLTPAEAKHHLDLIERHLLGPTGVYLFDAPVSYSGGTLHSFQRAEAATFWGREVGLMYTHAHIRWVQALATLGLAENMWDELLKIMPVGLGERVPGAAPRQANCYYSSSDAAFADRYQALANPEALRDPHFCFEGGWRVYSSGPGLLLRLLTEDMLGLRQRAAGLEIDPVLPATLDGLRARVPIPGGWLRVRYHVGAGGHGVRRVTLDGREVTGAELGNRYRHPGIRLAAGLLDGLAEPSLEVWVGTTPDE
ncbi:GH36-type glycosyl hydrolase domain-containing protein [Tessaracoccus sp. SD287]|uniref:GH36-type glycosyl hydrolase domain-containing protein n=1 Tax=Tessaracoccus sp. SD287 TaxID=2782008 RepID=UPI001A967FBC|nr:hypothetical protein [Tessaracoccus sp. SD287]